MSTEAKMNSNSANDELDEMPTTPVLRRVLTTYGKHGTPGIAITDTKLEAHNEEIKVYPGIIYNSNDYSGLPYDPENLTHLSEPMRSNMLEIRLLEKPKMVRQTNRPDYIPDYIPELIEDDMPAANPVFGRTDSVQHYNIPKNE